MKFLESLVTAASVFGIAALHGAVHAQAFPSKPVTFVVPYPAGGPIDAVARAMGQKLSERWKQTVIIDNRPGGSEVIASQVVRVAVPDGHTILVAGDPALSINQFTFKKLAYDPVHDFTPVTRLVTFNMALVVPATLPVGNLKEFVAYAKSKPGTLSFGSAGQGGPVHFSYTDLASTTGIDMTFVPYTGLAPIIQDMLGGRIDATFGALSVLHPHITAGKLKALAVGGKTRSKLLPDVPTFDELGYKGIDASFYIGLAVPSKTPADVVTKIANDVREVITTPEFISKNIDLFALEVSADGPSGFAEFLVANRKHQAQRVKLSGFQAN